MARICQQCRTCSLRGASLALLRRLHRRAWIIQRRVFRERRHREQSRSGLIRRPFANSLTRFGRWPRSVGFRAPLSTTPSPASPSIPQVVASAESQPEFVRPIWDYVASAVSADRVERGRDRARSESLWLARAKETFGVDDAVILGRLGAGDGFRRFCRIEQHHSVLASLAYIHFQGDYFRDELLSALVILEEGDIAPSLMRGSWAGAMGQTQFMPSSYLAYAVAFQRHDRRDIWTSEADAIGSTANYLAKHGWTKGLPWGFEVRLPAKFALDGRQFLVAGAVLILRRSRRGQRADGSPLPESGEGRLLILAGLNGPVFLVTSNFDVIKTYNNSTAYALSVGLLGDAVTGGPGLVARWPTHDRPLTATQIQRLQVKLKKMGYDVGRDRRENRRHAALGRAAPFRSAMALRPTATPARRCSAGLAPCDDRSSVGARLFGWGRHARRPGRVGVIQTTAKRRSGRVQGAV